MQVTGVQYTHLSHNVSGDDCRSAGPHALCCPTTNSHPAATQDENDLRVPITFIPARTASFLPPFLSSMQ
jgi:hypothetical protein